MKTVLSVVLGASSVTGSLVQEPKANTSLAKVSDAVPFGDMRGNEKREKLAEELQAQVRRDFRANYRISDLFANLEKSDDVTLKREKADKNLLALIQQGSRVAPAKTVSKGPFKQASIDDVQKQINVQRELVVDIHSPFADKEKQDAHDFEKIRKDRSMQALLQTPDAYDWRKMSDEITESARENGLGETVAAAGRRADSDVDYSAVYGSSATATDASSSMDSTSSPDSYSETTNMDAMNKYISKFNVENDKPSDVPKKMNPTDFSQDVSHSSNYGGSVISIPLSSQLQVGSTSFLQRKSLASTASKKIAPGVEEEVAKEKKWDVYLSDGFRQLEQKDAAEVKRMKSRKEYKE